MLTDLGFTLGLLGYDQLHAFGAHWLGKLFLLTVIPLFLWHAAHRFRVTLHGFGLRQDSVVAIIVYLAAASGTALAVQYLWRI